MILRRDSMRATGVPVATIPPASDRRSVLVGAGAGLAALLAGRAASAAGSGPQHGIARYGQPALPATFRHFPYVNPEAPKGGRLTLSQLGTFDSMNPYISRGTVPEGITSQVVQSLMMRSLDEPFTLYGLVAEGVETDARRSMVQFTLNPAARFSDGRPVTADDIRFTFELLRERGRPNQRTTFRRVRAVELPDPRTIRFVFQDPDGELPLILALMPALARHAIDPATFEQPSFRAPLGSGPYVLAEVDPGKSFMLRRNPNAWSAEVPALAGHHNFDEIKVEFYRDSNALFEAFKVGLYDVRVEADPGRWLGGYDFPAVRAGRVILDRVRFEAPRGMTGIMFNTRRGPLADIRVREALQQVFDFEWVNRNLFQGAYVRQQGYFDQSELSAVGRPISEGERAILGPHIGMIRPDVQDGTWRAPVSDGSGRDRQRLQSAATLLREAGYQPREGRMRKVDDGTPLEIEFLAISKEQERVALAFGDGLRPLGIGLTVRLVDSSLYWRRLRTFDIEAMIWSYPTSASPGAEQANRFSSQAADREASLNYAGVRSPAVDAALAAMRSAQTADVYVASVRALDRALISGAYALPLYHAPERWIARSQNIRRAERTPRFEMNHESWWRA
jgi:peptide/nickel transport system substrate-binding protein